jgi:two-component system chemotaxis response regulator CheY
MRTIQKRCLDKLGITEFAEAADGIEALRVLETTLIDLVLTDWNMPNMDGLTLLKEIRKRNTKIPVFMITTEGERNRVVEAIQAGVSDYLVKPFTPDALKQKLEKWVNLPAMA